MRGSAIAVRDVVVTLEKACRVAGYPKTIRVDNGSEFISRDMDLWAYQRGVTLDLSRPGKPNDNAFIEAFNSKLPERMPEHPLVPVAGRRLRKVGAVA